MYKSFTEMPVWNNAHSFATEVFKLTINLPRSEDYSLTSQIRRSSSSVAANIAEAFGRRTKKDKANFYTIARGSVFETQNHLIYGKSVGYFKQEDTEILFSNYTKLIYELNKIINALK